MSIMILIIMIFFINFFLKFPKIVKVNYLTFYSDYKPGWTQIGSKSYNMYKHSVNFDSALKACRDNSARLATLQDPDTQVAVASKSFNVMFVLFKLSQRVYN